MPPRELRQVKNEYSLGFLTVIDHGSDGLFGGYLVTNESARPLEFHCTTPIMPNRAQQILYGPTLEPYLYGEQIGQTLLTRAAAHPMLICTDRSMVMCVEQFVDTPVALVIGRDKTHVTAAEAPQHEIKQSAGPDDHVRCVANALFGHETQTQKTWRIDDAHATKQSLHAFHLGRNHLAVSGRRVQERSEIAERLAGLAESFDLAEPFERIRAAIEEARRGGQ